MLTHDAQQMPSSLVQCCCSSLVQCCQCSVVALVFLHLANLTRHDTTRREAKRKKYIQFELQRKQIKSFSSFLYLFLFFISFILLFFFFFFFVSFLLLKSLRYRYLIAKRHRVQIYNAISLCCLFYEQCYFFINFCYLFVNSY